MGDLIALGAFAITRVWGALILTLGSRHQPALDRSSGYHATVPMPASPGYLGVVTNWDGQWYESIALHGYPTHLPESAGVVQQNEWAFYPLYPELVRGGMELTNWSFPVVATLVSLACGAIASVVLFRLFARSSPPANALASVLLLNTFVAAPALQMAYPESVALLLLALLLSAWANGHWGWVAAITIPLALTRPLLPAVAMALMAHLILRTVSASRARTSLRPLLPHAAATAAAGGATFLWPLVCAVVTGRPLGYFETMAAWPIYGTITFGLGWFGHSANAHNWALLALEVLFSIVVLTLAIRRQASAWCTPLRLWGCIYPLYLLFFTAPGPSMTRYLLLALTPFWPFPDSRDGETASGPSWWVVTGLALLGLALQYLWTGHVVVVTGDPAQQAFP